jgi:hypothetical protein
MYQYAMSKLILAQYNELFLQFPPELVSDISNAEKRQKGWLDHLSLVYGEVTYEALLQVILADVSLPPTQKGVFIDIGSGSSRSLMIAALCHQWKCIIGVEILSSLHETAIEIAHTWEKMYNYKCYCTNGIRTESTMDASSNMSVLTNGLAHLTCSDNQMEDIVMTTSSHSKTVSTEDDPYHDLFLLNHAASYMSVPINSTNSVEKCFDMFKNNNDDHSAVYNIDTLAPPTSPIALYLDDLRTFDWSHADVLFINSTCFDSDLMYNLRQKCSQLRLGTYILMLTKRLQHSHFRRLYSHSVEMSWGEATIHVYFKTQSATMEFDDTFTEE